MAVNREEDLGSKLKSQFTITLQISLKVLQLRATITRTKDVQYTKQKWYWMSWSTVKRHLKTHPECAVGSTLDFLNRVFINSPVWNADISPVSQIMWTWRGTLRNVYPSGSFSVTDTNPVICPSKGQFRSTLIPISHQLWEEEFKYLITNIRQPKKPTLKFGNKFKNEKINNISESRSM